MEYKSIGTIFLSIAIALLAIASILFYYYEGMWYIALVPPIILGIAMLAFKKPLDEWGFKFQDVKIDDKLTKLLQTEYPEINSYSPDELATFRKRMFYFLFERESYLVVGEPEELDLYHVILTCAPAVIMSMYGKEDRGDDVERIAAYNHAFPSPKMKFLHPVEYDAEDGVAIISLEQLILCLRMPREYYHIAYHLWCERKLNLDENYPDVPSEFRSSIDEIYGFKKVEIDKLLAYELNDYRIISLHAFLTRKQEMQETFPDFSREILNYLKR